ncbi:MAG: histone deacetylase [Treponema sp.]|nr:histone deacetylase [Treponema sp.]
MILYDPALNMNFHDYGIMLPIAPDRGRQILEFMIKSYHSGAKGEPMPYPGPVLNIAGALAFLGTRSPDQKMIASWEVITKEDLERVHNKQFVDSLYNKQKKGLEPALLTAFELIDAQGNPNRYEPQQAKKPLNDLFRTILAQAGGTYLACRLALAADPGFCFFMGGGMHHARYDSGSGFCLINDSVIAIAKILSESALPLIWIIDIDAHKGDGTAELIHFARERGNLQKLPKASAKKSSLETQASNGKPCILTLSMHMARGWPLDSESLTAAKEGRAPLVCSDIDIEIGQGEETAYIPRLEAGIKELERFSAAIFPAGQKPDLVLVVDGADTYEHDELPSSSLLKLSLEQCLQRDNYVYRYVTDRSIPSAWIQAGGYGSRAWEPPAHFLLNLKQKGLL